VAVMVAATEMVVDGTLAAVEIADMPATEVGIGVLAIADEEVATDGATSMATPGEMGTGAMTVDTPGETTAGMTPLVFSTQDPAPFGSIPSSTHTQ